MADPRERQAKRILTELGKLRKKIDDAEALTAALYERRTAIFLEGRELVPPLVHREMGEAAGVTDAAVIHQTARALRRKQEMEGSS